MIGRPPGPLPPSNVTVPNVVGLDADDAQSKLKRLGFAVSREEIDNGGSAGVVAGTTPSAGTQAKKGSTVTLRISSGDSEQLRVPNVIGLEQADAVQALRSAGFSNINTQVEQTTQAGTDGLVLAQTPQAGQQADADGQVQLVVGQLVPEPAN